MPGVGRPAPVHKHLRAAGVPLTCVVCRTGTEFARREVQLNTRGLTFLGLDWLDKAGDAAVCLTCGYVHVFLGDAHEWY